MEKKSRAIWLAFRPKTLTAAVVPVLAGTGLAVWLGDPWQLSVTVLAISSALFIQIGTNLINDWADFKTGADNENRIGPQRATQLGWLAPKTVFRLGLLSFLIAALLGLPLVLWGGWPIVAIGCVSVLCGYAYTAGPFPLAYHGLGDIFVILFFGIVAVCGTHYLHSGQWNLTALWLGLQIGFLATSLIAINNMRDAHEDRKVNKRTLAVRFGERFSRAEICFLLLVPFAMNFYYEDWFVTLLPLLALPIALLLCRDVFRTPPSDVYNRFLARAAAVHLLFGLLISTAFIV